MSRSRLVLGVVLVMVCVGMNLSDPTGHAASWDPVDQKELALTTPVVDKDADAEAILWDVQVTDERMGDSLRTIYEHYLRIKIFTDRGREQQSRVDIPHVGSVRVRDVAGRTIKRDGSTIELKGSDVFERDLVRASGLKLKSTSFVLPGVETGGLVEYRWTEYQDDVLSQNMRLPFSREIPVQLVRYHIQPLPLAGTIYMMKGMPFHANPTPLVREKSTRFMTSLSNVSAYPDERRAPSEWELRPWLLIYYDTASTAKSPVEFWTRYSKDLYDEFRKVGAPTSEMRRAVSGLVSATATPDEKLAAALTFSRTKIKRIDLDTVSDAERKGFKRNDSPMQAIQKGRGTARDVANVFVAAANALGLDARIALFPSRYDTLFDPGMMLPQLLREAVIAVKMPDGWRFYDPTNTYSPTGRVRWTNEGQQGFIADDVALTRAKIPVSPPEWSTRKRTAALALAEDGTLEGDITVEYGGHFDISLKEDYDHLAEVERVKDLTDAIVKRFPGAEVTKMEMAHVTEAEHPFTTTYHLKVPAYAQKTGARLFFQPSVFEKGVEPEFTAPQRTQSIFFDYAWRELDEITIALPAGYGLEAADKPGDLQLSTIGGYKLKLVPADNGSRIEFRREFFFGAEQRLSFPQAAYRQLKQFFDDVSHSDGFTLTLRRVAAGENPGK